MFLNNLLFLNTNKMDEKLELTEKERQYTSTVAKILAHPDRLEEIENGIFRPISIQLAPTDTCNLKCDFCSVWNRNGDELSLEEVVGTLKNFRELGALGVELTGGGDPTMYPYINETIEMAFELGYDIGMITNGVMLKRKVKQENLDRLTWLRISLNSLDYVKDIEIPQIKGTLGFSYVWNQRTDPNMLERLSNYAEEYGADFVRVVPNCLNIEEQKLYQDQIKPIIERYPKLFFQQKEYKVPELCWIGYLKPFITPDGNISRCSANPLIERKFNDRFVMGNIRDISSIYENVNPFETGYCQEGKCFFKEQNDFIKKVKDNQDLGGYEGMKNIDIPHPNFI